MFPINFEKILTVAAPIVASIISNNNKSEEVEVIERPVTKTVNNISISVTNNFYARPESDSLKIASEIQNKMLESFSDGNRYKL